MLLLGGMGILGRVRAANSLGTTLGNLPLLTGGLGGRTPHTAHPETRNTTFYDPDTDAAYRGDDGDPEWAMMTAEPNNPYNSRSVQIFLPKNAYLPGPAMKRLETFLRLTKPFTINTRVISVDGVPRIELLDPAEEV